VGGWVSDMDIGTVSTVRYGEGEEGSGSGIFGRGFVDSAGG